MYVLRKAKKDFLDIVSGCNSMDGIGNVYAWVLEYFLSRSDLNELINIIESFAPNGNAPGARASRMQIDNYKKLSNFCAEVIISSVSAYISDW